MFLCGETIIKLPINLQVICGDYSVNHLHYKLSKNSENVKFLLYAKR